MNHEKFNASQIVASAMRHIEATGNDSETMKILWKAFNILLPMND